MTRVYRSIGFAAGIFLLSAAARAYDWTQFNGDPQHSGANARETVIGPSNVATLRPAFQATLPAVCDGAPVYLSHVGRPGGARDMLFCVTMPGDLVALDAHTGAILWTKSNPPGGCKINNGSSSCYTTSSPAIDPSRLAIYAYGLDGRVHRYRPADGTETTSGGWPELATTKGFNEKSSSPLATAVNATGTPFLYVCNGGYPGDRGDYQGHVTSVDLTTGAQNVFNAACSDQNVHFMQSPGTPDCAHVQSAIWSRSGAVYDAVTNRVFVVSGNGDYDGNAMGHDWGDSVIALHPNGTGSAGNPIDAFTPANFQQLQDADLDLGSTAPAILPAAGFSGRLGLQSGKDAMLRLLRLDDLSGHGGPGFTGGALQTLAVPQGGLVFSAPAVWIRPADGSTWTFVGNGSGISALRLTASGSSASVSTQWKNGDAATSPLLAGNILFYAGGGTLHAVTPASGGSLWTSPVGSIHWESPVVADGALYLSDGASHLTGWVPALSPVSLATDAHAVTGSNSNVDGLIEPGETVELAPSWKNNGSSAASFGGTLSGFTGPAGATYTIADATAQYASIPAGGAGTCHGSASGCYRIGISSPASRPALHWDATATETLGNGTVRKWSIHVGKSFSDVSPSQPFYGYIEALLHSGITLGCSGSAYCPGSTVARNQVAAFVARAAFRSDAAVPVAGNVPGVGAYSCRTGGVSLFSDVPPTDPFCRHVHWLAAGGRSFSCDEEATYGSTWCPAAPIDRRDMATILARDLAGGDDLVPASRPDPGNGRGYDCTDGSANAFIDVPDSDPGCKFVYYIWSFGIIDGNGDGTYAPNASVTRDQMAKFLVNAYGLTPF